MKQYKFEDKLWVLKEIDKGRDRKSIAYEFYYKHLHRWKNKQIKRGVIIRRITRLFLDWENIRHNYGMDKLKLGGGNRTSKKKGRPKKVSINDLGENDREVYQKIVEDILKDHGISKSEITERIKKEKDKIKNTKGLTAAFGINRTSIYYKSKKTEKPFLFDHSIITAIQKLIVLSRKSIGRDKAYAIISRTNYISTYVFRKHWESLGYKSNYHIKYNRKPKEKKYKGIWANDHVNFEFDGKHEDDIWYSDITYIKVDGKYKMALLIKDGFTKKIKFLKLVSNRKSSTIIEALRNSRNKSKRWPKVFHSDHGIEYANYKLKAFLEKHSIMQSMSPKGNSLANRPSEYFFASLKREFIYPFVKDIDTEEKLNKVLKDYKYWYHNFRVQKCLEYKTPYEYSRMMSSL